MCFSGWKLMEISLFSIKFMENVFTVMKTYRVSCEINSHFKNGIEIILNEN